MPNTYRRMDMKKTILVIEDDVIFSRSICNWLSKNDMITKSVTMLSAARKHLATKEFDLILADLRLRTETAQNYSGGCMKRIWQFHFLS